MNEPTKAELLKVVAEAMEWGDTDDGFALVVDSEDIYATLDNDTDLGNQIAIAQMMLWLHSHELRVEESSKGGWIVEIYDEKLGRGAIVEDSLCQALAQVIYTVFKEQTQ